MDAMQTKVGYIAIYRTSDYGGRVVEEDTTIYETKTECIDACSGNDNFLTVATVTWKET